MMKRYWRIVWLPFFLGCVLLSACGGKADTHSAVLQAKAPFLTTAETRALTDPNPDRFTELSRHLGADRLIALSGKFLTAVFVDTTTTESDRMDLLPAYRQVTAALRDVNQCPEFQTELEFFLTLPATEARLALELSAEQDRIFTAPGLSASERTTQLTAIHEDLISSGHDLAAAQGWSYRGTLATRSGQPDLAREMFTAGLEHSRRHHLRSARCNALASLIMQGFAEGNTDSTSILLERGLRLARTSRLGTQTGRLLALSGYQAFGQGHYAAAVHFFEDGVTACRDFGSPAKGLAYLGTLLRLYAVMESWDMVDQVAQRATVMLREAKEVGNDDPISALQSIRQQEIQARSLMARGKIEAAHDAYSHLWDQVMAQPFEEASFVANYWIMGLLDHSCHDLAAVALTRAESYAQESQLRHMLIRLPFWRARVFFKQDETDSARVQLDKFAAEGLAAGRWTSDLEIPYFILRARLLAQTDTAAADTTLVAGLVNLTGRLAESGGSAGAFLDLSRARDLRWAAHDIVGSEPTAGYGLELMWRQLLGVSGPDSPAPFTRQTNLRAEIIHTAEQAESRLKALGAVHLLYQVREDQVVRWTVSHSIRRDTLATPTAELRQLVGAAQAAMSVDPGDINAELDPALRQVLSKLAQALLPDSLRDPDQKTWPRALLISGESFLAQIPFATLNLGSPKHYTPLGAKVDLAWLRNPSAEPCPTRNGVNLVIADPQIDPVLRRRFRTLKPLTGIDAELNAVRGVIPVQVLQGEAATKAAISAATPTASLVYFMGHILHNPEAPFLTSIPLTPPSGPHLSDTAALDLADIRGGDYSGCRLVVLSGCGSGHSFVDGLITAPSLGDAFLDAGASASLQTFWQIRDASPTFRPTEVMRLWQDDGLPLTAALGTARREAMNGPRGVRHPFGWGAWSLKLNSLPDWH